MLSEQQVCLCVCQPCHIHIFDVLSPPSRQILCDSLGGHRCILTFDEGFKTFTAKALGAIVAKGSHSGSLSSPQPFKGLMKGVRLVPKALPSVLVQAVGKVTALCVLIFSADDDVLKYLVMTHSESSSGLLSQKQQLLSGILPDGQSPEDATRRLLRTHGLSELVATPKIFDLDLTPWEEATASAGLQNSAGLKPLLMCGDDEPQYVAIVLWQQPRTATGNFSTGFRSSPTDGGVSKLFWGWFSAIEAQVKHHNS